MACIIVELDFHNLYIFCSEAFRGARGLTYTNTLRNLGVKASGSLTKDEFLETLGKWSDLSVEELEECYDLIDLDGGGDVSTEEFCAALQYERRLFEGDVT